MPDIPGNNSTSATIGVGESLVNTLETVGDRDWFRIELTAGQSITVSLDGVTLVDPYLRIRDANGNLVYENDDIILGTNRDSLLSFTANYTGTYYIEVGAWEDNYAGDYHLSVSPFTMPPLATNDEVADQLVSGYWVGDTHRFNVSEGGSITVNLTALTAAGQNLARQALGLWSDIIGVDFVEVATGGQITFDDDQEGAFSDGTWSNGFITTTHVNVSTEWLSTYGTGLNSYSFQTYVHEIGHALGLGHAGNYNETARYPYDVEFQNDSWAVSVMSYFDQNENTYFAGQGFTVQFIGTPMVADIVAMAELYGLSTTTRTGDTTYGFNSNAGRDVFNAALYPNIAYTVFDSGGVDTLDYSQFAAMQRINLNAETFSNVGGNVGNVSIARGVVIENAIGGSGRDTIIGNAADNVLTGGAGEDIVSYETAAAGVHVDLRLATRQNTVGAGQDTLSGFENLIGSAFDDVLVGAPGSREIYGGSGDDHISGNGGGGYNLYGEEGDDRFTAGAGDDWISGGVGFDTVDYSSATGAVTVATNVANNDTGASGMDSLTSVERLIGSSFDDNLWASEAGHVVEGGAGNDTLKGSVFGMSRLVGGIGNDTYIVNSAIADLVENANEGTELVRSDVSFTLGANLENLELVSSAGDIDGTGNTLANRINGNNSSNRISGVGGNDELNGFDGDDTLEGGDGNDRLHGGGGIDIATYAGAAAGVVVSLATTADQDTIGAGVDSLTAVEGLAGSAFGDSLTGNSAANALLGGDGDDFLIGAGGVDQLDGGDGSDVYVIRAAGEHSAAEIADSGSGGIDELHFSAATAQTLTLHSGDSGLERVLATGIAAHAIDASALVSGVFIIGNDAANVVTGSAFADRLQGNHGDDRLIGNAGNDILDGNGGIDRMIGGDGDDIYIVRDSTDFAYENAGEGHDQVISEISAALRHNIEQLTLTGTGNITGRGNDLDNLIEGNSGRNDLIGLDGDDRMYGGDGNDELDGGAGVDRMYGGHGDDAYIVRDSTDFAYERGGEGYDRVYSPVSIVLRENVERLTLTGTADIYGRGNDEDNVVEGNPGSNALLGLGGDDRIYGGARNDEIEGGAGVDRMYGGVGDDIYVVTDSTDFAYERAGEGFDRVYSSVTVVLRDNLERLQLTGGAAIDGYGNSGANDIVGNNAANLLDGREGNDWIEGGAGQDRFFGGAGSDLFVFRDGDFGGADQASAERIHDFSAADGDRVRLDLVDANTNLGGDQGFAFIGTDAFSGTAGELRFEQLSGNTYVSGDTDGDGVADFMIRLDGVHSLTSDDFIF